MIFSMTCRSAACQLRARVDKDVPPHVAHMHPGQSTAGIVVTDQPLSVARGGLDVHDVSSSNGGNSRTRAGFARKQSRPIRCQVEARVRNAEMFAQATAAISMGTAGRPRTDDGSALRHGEAPVSPCIEGRRRSLVTSVADASTIICESAITRGLKGEIAMEVFVMMSGMTAMVARRLGIGLKRDERQAKQCDQYRHDTCTIHGVPRALKIEKRLRPPWVTRWGCAGRENTSRKTCA